MSDAIFQTTDAFETRSVTNIVVSDAPDLCERVRSGGSLAGHSELTIKHWGGGTIEVVLREYDAECGLAIHERTAQGWADQEYQGPGQVGLDVVFRTEARNVSGRVVANYCELPDDRRVGCDR